MSDDYKPRFSFEISFEQKERADRLLSNYGLRKAVFGTILDDVLDLIDHSGGVAIGILMSNQCKPRDILPSMHKANKIGKLIGEEK
jgi:hypothetical protein